MCTNKIFSSPGPPAHLICFALSALFLSFGAFLSNATLARAHPDEGQKVFTDLGLPHADVVMDIYKGQLRMREPKSLPASPSCYLVDGLKFCKDLKEIESNYKDHSAESSLSIRDGVLFYKEARVPLPPGVEMRQIWQAVLWKGWVICLGRTSKTDKPAKMTPPFFATELVTFDPAGGEAKVKYLSFNPPGDTRVYILSPK
jgi:hypothetical protein